MWKESRKTKGWSRFPTFVLLLLDFGTDPDFPSAVQEWTRPWDSRTV